MFSGPSNYAEYVDSTMLFIVGISVVLLLGITFAMIYFVFKYSRKRNPVATQIHGNIILEIIWIVIPTVIVLAMFWYGYEGYRSLRIDSEEAFTVKVTAFMWGWEFEYENGKKSDTLYIPVDKMTKLSMQSRDVNHSLYIPAFRMKEDVIGGRNTFMFLNPTEKGTYDIACAEYCGLNHSMMYTKLKVVTEDEYTAWINILPEKDIEVVEEAVPETEAETQTETIDENN